LDGFVSVHTHTHMAAVRRFSAGMNDE
jgi:hypothetical protein